jgi:hypothetical protein
MPMSSSTTAQLRGEPPGSVVQGLLMLPLPLLEHQLGVFELLASGAFLGCVLGLFRLGAREPLEPRVRCANSRSRRTPLTLANTIFCSSRHRHHDRGQPRESQRGGHCAASVDRPTPGAPMMAHSCSRSNCRANRSRSAIPAGRSIVVPRLRRVIHSVQHTFTCSIVQ